MTSLSSPPGKAGEHEEKEDLVLYIEELVGEGDYWLSITDAARVCRVQDISIRRAITRGILPVRRQRAGQNKRTRLVRASDLPKAGFPIIDESAVITTEIGKADILSIPQQQQRIMQEYQQVMEKLLEMQESLTAQQARVLADFQQQQEQFQLKLQALQKESASQLAAAEQRLVQEQEKLRQQLAEMGQQQSQEQHRIQQTLAQLQTEVRQQEANFRGLWRAQQEVFEHYQGETREALENLAAAQQEMFQAYQQTVDARLQQIAEEARGQLILLEQYVASSLETSTRATSEHLAGQARQIADLQQTYEQVNQTLATRDQRLERALQDQQRQLDQHAQLLPLLSYVNKKLVTEQSLAEHGEALAEMEARLQAAHRSEFARYQPLLALLEPARLEALGRLLDEVVSANKKADADEGKQA
jgi:chromosome segregation ATPase